MNMEAEWVMVWITLVYVVATIFICWANFKTARASKEQLEASKKEHDESLRIEIMPFLQFELCDEKDINYRLCLPLSRHEKCDRVFTETMRLSNVGNGAATNITYTWADKKNPISITEPFCVNAVRSGGELKIHFEFDCCRKDISASKKYPLTFFYDDMRGYSYEQRMIFTAFTDGESVGIAEVETDSPVYTGVKTIC